MSGIATVGVPPCEGHEVEPGTIRRVERKGHTYAVFNVGGRFHVTDDTCTRGFASLSNGMLDGDVVRAILQDT